MPRIIFFDLETRLLAADLRPDDEQAGWDALRAGEGGISAACLYDTKLHWCYTYDDTRTSIHALARHLEAADIVVGYNSERFDVPVIEGLSNRNLRLRQHIDLYTEIARALAAVGHRTTVGDLKLDTVCRRNLGRGKIDSGAHAKALAADGRWADLFNYCLDDVHLTHDLFRYAAHHGGVHVTGYGWLPLTFPPAIIDWAKE